MKLYKIPEDELKKLFHQEGFVVPPKSLKKRILSEIKIINRDKKQVVKPITSTAWGGRLIFLVLIIGMIMILFKSNNLHSSYNFLMVIPITVFTILFLLYILISLTKMNKKSLIRE